MSSVTLTLGAKNREKENKLRKKIENRKKMRKELSSLLAILTGGGSNNTISCAEVVSVSTSCSRCSSLTSSSNVPHVR